MEACSCLERRDTPESVSIVDRSANGALNTWLLHTTDEGVGFLFFENKCVFFFGPCVQVVHQSWIWDMGRVGGGGL